MKVRVLFAVGLMTLAAQTAKAQAVGDAGCGLGSMVIQEQTKLMQILASTTNFVTFTQVFGITSGTSNCRAQNFVMREKAVQYFAEINKDDLSREMAQGQGEKLNTLAALYGCEGPSAAVFAQKTQAAFEQIVPASDTNAIDMVKNLNHQIAKDPSLVETCRAI